MNKNFPRLKEAEVKVIMPFEKIDDIRGKYNFEVLFLSEWASEKSFDEYHSRCRFINLAKKTRNKSFSAFTESKAHLMTPKIITSQ